MQFAILLEQPQSPGDALLEIGVPGRVVFQPERWPAVKVIEEEKDRIRIVGQPDLWCRDVREYGERHAVAAPAEGVTEQPEKIHRSLPPVSRDVGYVHRCRAVLQ